MLRDSCAGAWPSGPTIEAVDGLVYLEYRGCDVHTGLCYDD
jgi:hypothetical protein